MAVSIINYQEETVTEYEKLINDLFLKINETREFSVVLVSSDYILELNNKYKQRNYVTDVLSFPTNNEIENDLGDIFICLEQAQKQAKTYKHSVSREVMFLVVHGYLHLLGYDHMDEQSEKEMMAKTEEILAYINLSKKVK